MSCCKAICGVSDQSNDVSWARQREQVLWRTSVCAGRHWNRRHTSVVHLRDPPSLERERTLPECNHGPLFPKESTVLRVSRTLAMVLAWSPSPPLLSALSASNCDLVVCASARFHLNPRAVSRPVISHPSLGLKSRTGTNFMTTSHNSRPP